MAYVVAEPCIKCKFTDCVAVCPVDAFREGANMLVIDPDTCIDCDLCVPECPVSAIFSEGDLPEEYASFKDLNARLAKQWPTISAKKDALPEAEQFREVKGKLKDLDESPGPGT